jgi:hypothetical protein
LLGKVQKRFSDCASVGHGHDPCGFFGDILAA